MKIKYTYFIPSLTCFLLFSLNCFADGLAGLGGVLTGAIEMAAVLILTVLSFFSFFKKRRSAMTNIIAIIQIIVVLKLSLSISWKDFFDVKDSDGLIIVLALVFIFIVSLVNVINLIRCIIPNQAKLPEKNSGNV